MIKFGDERLGEVYQQERDKGSLLPDADADHVALESALRRRSFLMEATTSKDYYAGPIQ
jgi:hypothetical protein